MEGYIKKCDRCGEHFEGSFDDSLCKPCKEKVNNKINYKKPNLIECDFSYDIEGIKLYSAEQKRNKVNEIFDITAEYTTIPKSYFFKRKEYNQNIVKFRRIIIKILKEFFNMSHSEIAFYLGKSMRRSSVTHNLHKFEELYVTDKDFRTHALNLKHKIKNINNDDVVDLPHKQINELYKKIVDIFNLKYNDLLSKNKEEPYATYRKIAMYILYVNLPVSQPQLSKFFGKKHHSAVTYAIRTTKEWMIHNREFRQKIDTIQNKLNKLENQNQ